MIKIYYTENYKFAIPFKAWTFPAGERGFELLSLDMNKVTIECMWQGSDDLIDIINAVSAIRDTEPHAVIDLDIPYFPFGRQDRRTTSGSPNSLKAFAAVINSLNFNKVLTDDPHSDVMPAVVDRLEYTKQGLGYSHVKIDCLVAPDAGASKKIYSVAEAYYGMPVVVANKRRDPTTGKITATTISDSDVPFLYGNVMVVDDICDGGATFIELAKVIKQVAPDVKLHLYVTHGLFTKGKEVLQQYYETTSCKHDFTLL